MIPFALWLVPEPDTRARLNSTIGKLAVKYAGTPFPAHMTLLGGSCEDLSLVSKRMKELVGPALALTNEGTAVDEVFFKTFFIKLGTCASLNGLFRRARLSLDPASPYQLAPHLSLLYKDEVDGQALLAESIDLPTTIVFDGLWLVSPGNSDLLWRDIDAWQIHQRLVLA